MEVCIHEKVYKINSELSNHDVKYIQTGFTWNIVTRPFAASTHSSLYKVK